MDTRTMKENLAFYSAELNKYQGLSRQMLSYEEMMLVDNKIVQIKRFIKRLRAMLDARQ